MNREQVESTIEFYAKRFQIPPTLAKAQAVAESSLDPHAINQESRAVGLFQIVPGTAAWLMGDPEIAACAGLRYMEYLHAAYAAYVPDPEAWKFALAAYDWGQSNVTVARQQADAKGLDPDTFENLAPYCPQETQAYVAKICAAAFGEGTGKREQETGPMVIDPEISV